MRQQVLAARFGMLLIGGVCLDRHERSVSFRKDVIQNAGNDKPNDPGDIYSSHFLDKGPVYRLVEIKGIWIKTPKM